jgi:hypothetical protein
VSRLTLAVVAVLAGGGAFLVTFMMASRRVPPVASHPHESPMSPPGSTPIQEHSAILQASPALDDRSVPPKVSLPAELTDLQKIIRDSDEETSDATMDLRSAIKLHYADLLKPCGELGSDFSYFGVVVTATVQIAPDQLSFSPETFRVVWGPVPRVVLDCVQAMVLSPPPLRRFNTDYLRPEFPTTVREHFSVGVSPARGRKVDAAAAP